jgi:hypothetical protein
MLTQLLKLKVKIAKPFLYVNTNVFELVRHLSLNI